MIIWQNDPMLAFIDVLPYLLKDIFANVCVKVEHTENTCILYCMYSTGEALWNQTIFGPRLLSVFNFLSLLIIGHMLRDSVKGRHPQHIS